MRVRNHSLNQLFQALDLGFGAPETNKSKGSSPNRRNLSAHGRPWPALTGLGQPWPAMAGHGPLAGQCRPWPLSVSSEQHRSGLPFSQLFFFFSLYCSFSLLFLFLSPLFLSTVLSLSCSFLSPVLLSPCPANAGHGHLVRSLRFLLSFFPLPFFLFSWSFLFSCSFLPFYFLFFFLSLSRC